MRLFTQRAVSLFVGLVVAVLGVATAAVAEPQDEDQSKLITAIEKGREALLRSQSERGIWDDPGAGHMIPDEAVGTTALALFLLESRVSSDHAERWKSGLDQVRKAAARPDFNHTESLCKVVFLLCRLQLRNKSRREDLDLVRGIMRRLVKEQGEDGFWPTKLPAGKVNANRTFLPAAALFVSRRLLEPDSAIDKALGRSADAVRNAQKGDGGWGNVEEGAHVVSRGIQTCEALLCLGFELGRKAERMDDEYFSGRRTSGGVMELYQTLDSDTKLRRGFDYLASVLKKVSNNVQPSREVNRFLFLMGEVLKLYRKGPLRNLNWHQLGGEYLLAKQSPSGAWEFSPGHQEEDTVLTLWFLSKANAFGPIAVPRTGAGPILGGPHLKPSKSVAQPSPEELRKRIKRLPDLGEKARFELLLDLEETRGAEVTDLIVEAIPTIASETRRAELRAVLASRVARLKSASLLICLEIDQPRELRMAAMRAFVKSPGRFSDDVKELAPALLREISEKDAPLADEASAALKALTHQDFGKDAAKWKQWLRTQDKP